MYTGQGVSITSANTESLSVTMTQNTGPQRTGIVGRTATYNYTLNSKYLSSSGTSTTSGSSTCNVNISQEADYITDYIVTIESNKSTFDSPLAGQTVTISGSSYAVWKSKKSNTASPATLSTTAGSLSSTSFAGSASKTEMATLTSVENTSVSSTKAYTVTIKNSANTAKTASVTITQSKAYYTYSAVSVSFSYPDTDAAGGTAAPTLTVSQQYGINGRSSGTGNLTTIANKTFSISASSPGLSLASDGKVT